MSVSLCIELYHKTDDREEVDVGIEHRELDNDRSSQSVQPVVLLQLLNIFHRPVHVRVQRHYVPPGPIHVHVTPDRNTLKKFRK